MSNGVTFQKRVLVYVDRMGRELCPMVLTTCMAIQGVAPGPFFLLLEGIPLLMDTLVKKMRKALYEEHCS